VGLRPLACWDCGFESRRKHGCLCLECCVLSVRGLCDGPITGPEGVLSSVVCLSVNWKPKQLSNLGPRGLSSQKNWDIG
jgi:hypothetical protein